MRYVTEATSLKSTWNQTFGSFFSQGVGLIIGWAFAVVGIAIALGVIAGWACKAASRSNFLVNTFATSGKVSLAFVAIGLGLASPEIFIPLLLGAWDELNTWLQPKATDVLNQASAMAGVAPMLLGL